MAPDGPDAISRFAGTTATTADDWYFGTVKGPSPFTYDTTSVSPNFPSGGTLSVGSANSASATPLPDLLGADFANGADLATSASGNDLTTSSADLTSATATLDAASAVAADQAQPASDLTDVTNDDRPDLRKATITTAPRHAAGCTTTPNNDTNFFSLICAVSALIVRRLRPRQA